MILYLSYLRYEFILRYYFICILISNRAFKNKSCILKLTKILKSFSNDIRIFRKFSFIVY